MSISDSPNQKLENQETSEFEALKEFKVLKRDGQTAQNFDIAKVHKAVQAAYEESSDVTNNRTIQSVVNDILHECYRSVDKRKKTKVMSVEDVQDIIENVLLRSSFHDTAKKYLLYRAERAKLRALRLKPDADAISNYVVAAKYARYDSDLGRREVWEESVDRYISMQIRRYPELESDLLKIGGMIKDKRVVGSMRGMQFGGKAVEEVNARAYNCSFTFMDHYTKFQKLFYLLLCGCGTGYSVQWHHVEQLPIVKRINKDSVKHFTVPDTIAGWADAIGALMTSYFRTGNYVEFAYHKIRDKGSVLRTSGGKAPGHLPLKQATERVRGILEGAVGRQLYPIEVHEIMCHLADAVLSGGIRRSAMNCIFSPDDGDMLRCKTGEWYKTKPWLARANNSTMMVEGEVKKSQFRRVFDSTRQFGEPGFVFSSSTEHGYNPCFPADQLLLTDKGYRSFGDLYESGESVNLVQDTRVSYIGPEADNNNPIYWKVSHSSDPGYEVNPADPVRLTRRQAPIVKVVTHEGLELRSTPDHHIAVKGRGMVAAEDLRPGDEVLVGNTAVLNDQVSEDLDYKLGLVYGWWAGADTLDENTARLDFYGSKSEWLSYISSAIHDIYDSGDYDDLKVWYDDNETRTVEWGSVKSAKAPDKESIDSVFISRVFTHLGLSKDGFAYGMSPSFIAGVATGLIGSTGTVQYSDGALSIRVYNTHRSLLRTLQDRLLPFGAYGILSGVEPKECRDHPDSCKETYELVFSGTSMDNLRSIIRLRPQHESEYAASKTLRESQQEFYATVAAVEDDGVEDVYCLSELKRRTVIVNGIVARRCYEIGFSPTITSTPETLEIIDQWAKDTGQQPPKLIEGKTYTGISFCNLTEGNCAKVNSAEDLYEIVWAAAVLGTLQAGYTDFEYLGWESEILARRDALLGVSLTGMMDRPDIALNPEIQRKAAELAVKTNKEYAAKIGIRPAARVTCVKPSGTASLALGCVGSGIHPHHANRYFRRIVANPLEPVYQHFAKYNPHMVSDTYGGDKIITFCVEAPPNAITRNDLTALEFLDKVRSTYQNWVVPGTARPEAAPGLTHNVSCTITVKDDEWDDVMEYLWANRKDFAAVSLLSHVGDKVYENAPREEVVNQADEAKWNMLLQDYKPVDYTAMVETEDTTDHKQEAACAGGACEIV